MAGPTPSPPPAIGATPSSHSAAEQHDPGADYSVLTPERVSLQYDVAGIGSRSAAALIDVGVQFALYLALLIAFGLSVSWFSLLSRVLPRWLPLLLFSLGIFALLWGYYFLFELAWSGQTPGKRLLHIRVIRENGYPIRAIDAVVRNLVRIVDGPPFGAIVGLLVMLCNARAKRLGDFAAGTLVVREAQLPSLASLTGWDAPEMAAPAPTGSAGTPAATLPALRAEDASLVRDFLVRRQEMDAPQRAALAGQLARSLAQRYGLSLPSAPASASPASASPASGGDEAFLERLAET